MDFSLSNFLFPRMCSICKRYGNYICDDCKKLLKRNLPECYICRRLSPSYVSHPLCKTQVSLEKVFVAWEYNILSSSILKQYKYKNVKDIAEVLSTLFIDSILASTFARDIEKTLLVPVPISNLRRNERGFNQMEHITTRIGKYWGLDIESNFISCRNSTLHQASKSKMERDISKENLFYIDNPVDISKYKSITLVDDVITTGNTLEKISFVIKSYYGIHTTVNALCMFRGKPYYLPT